MATITKHLTIFPMRDKDIVCTEFEICLIRNLRNYILNSFSYSCEFFCVDDILERHHFFDKRINMISRRFVHQNNHY